MGVKKPSFKTIAVAQLLTIVGGFVSWWLYRSTIYLHAPIGPSEEVYAHTWGFQSMVGLLYLVGLLILSTFVVLLERGIVDLMAWMRGVRRARVTKALFFNPNVGE